jgi:hypothetical protein
MSSLMILADLGATRRVFEHFLALSIFRFEGESTFPPTAANADR